MHVYSAKDPSTVCPLEGVIHLPDVPWAIHGHCFLFLSALVDELAQAVLRYLVAIGDGAGSGKNSDEPLRS